MNVTKWDVSMTQTDLGRYVAIHEYAMKRDECERLRARVAELEAQVAAQPVAVPDDIRKAVYASDGVRLRLLRDADYLDDNGYIMRAANAREAAALIETLATRPSAPADDVVRDAVRTAIVERGPICMTNQEAEKLTAVVMEAIRGNAT